MLFWMKIEPRKFIQDMNEANATMFDWIRSIKIYFH